MNDIIIEGLSTIISLAVGGLIGYAYAYFSGLKAVRKGMQLMLRGALDDMYVKFHHGAADHGRVEDGLKKCTFAMSI